ncbi:Endonuclease/exonuclease/phosphatase [Halteromyces radiatus]|uniref:Endonuclease/exonuclease/phosphatase n=1 Tax=Halteromyces radiatus TaxID=101107 RepID=UPI00221F2C7D|nr:Endonuclease/exonuclease/phosphatase [Halteromyces radiatus]KAI8097046.1 Endonuclease/exonuclease/phosphatase [Halteromyces radiatus]
MPPKRKVNNNDTTPNTEKKVKKSTAFVAFDPSLPNNMTFPDPLVISDEDKKTPGCVTIASYNVASLNACIKKGFNKYIDAEDADIVCIQETKVNAPVSTAVNDKVYKYRYWAFEEKKGYGGIAVFSKHKPSQVIYGLEGYESISRGRVILLTYPSFTLIACYSPNAGDKLVRLGEKQTFDAAMEKQIRSLQQKGIPVIWTGDLNVAHEPDDLARPDSNERSAGYTIEERTDFTKILSPYEKDPSVPGLVDSWRYLHPNAKGHYTYFSYRFRCREKLLGWRLDYFCLTPDLLPKMINSSIRYEVWGASDHVPIVLLLKDVSF